MSDVEQFWNIFHVLLPIGIKTSISNFILILPFSFMAANGLRNTIDFDGRFKNQPSFPPSVGLQL